MHLTLFWRRLRDDLAAEDRAKYESEDSRLEALARSIPGFVSAKSYTAEDGDRVTIVLFETEEAQEAWRRQPEHLVAQRFGRERIYEEYRSMVAASLRDRHWSRDRPGDGA